MSRRVEADGVVHEFPDDASDQEISTALNAGAKPPTPGMEKLGGTPPPIPSPRTQMHLVNGVTGNPLAEGVMPVDEPQRKEARAKWGAENPWKEAGENILATTLPGPGEMGIDTGIPLPTMAKTAAKTAKAVGAGLKVAPESIAEHLDIVHPLRVIPRVARDVGKAAYAATREAPGDINPPPPSLPPLAQDAPRVPLRPPLASDSPIQPPAAQPSSPTPAPSTSEPGIHGGVENTFNPLDFNQMMNTLKTQAEQKGIFPPGYKWGQGETGPGFRERFDEGGPSETIKPSKTTILKENQRQTPLPENAKGAANAFAKAMKKGK